MVTGGNDGERLNRFVEALTTQFGDNALIVVERQVALARREPAVAGVWQQIALRIRQGLFER